VSENPRSSAESSDVAGGARINPDGTDKDDWDDHWQRYGEAAEGNPANDYRHALILKLLGDLPAGATLLDIGRSQSGAWSTARWA